MESITTYDKLLEIFLVTFNRSVCLDNTLSQLKDSLFAKCRFTVLDNCSTDDTSNVIDKYRNYFLDFHVVRHNRNIGGDKNFLRAVELSKAVYTWVLCDDDSYDFSHASEIIEAVESFNFDLIYVASRSSVQLGWEKYGATHVKDLFKDKARYHRACAFWPALIFKSEQFDNRCYIDAPYLFPSLLFVNKSINENFSIYVSEYEIVKRYEGSVMEISPLYLFKEWVENTRLIRDKKLRSFIVEQWTDKGFFKTLFFWIAIEKAYKREGFAKRLTDIFFALTPNLKIKFAFLFPVMIVPLPLKWLFKARKLVYKMIGSGQNEMPPSHFEDISTVNK